MSTRPPIGARGRRFTIELPQDAPDGFGGVLRRWEPGPLAWGSLELLRSSERLVSGRPDTLATHRVIVPYREGLAPDQHLALGARRFRIRSADDPDGRRESVVCLVEEIAA